MTTTTISVTNCPVTPYRPTENTNYLVRVQYEYGIVDYNVFGPVGMPEHELLAAVQAAYPRDEATQIVRWAEL